MEILINNEWISFNENDLIIKRIKSIKKYYLNNNQLYPSMKLKFKCKSCQKETISRFNNFIYGEFNYKCIKCNRKETSLKKYGLSNNFQSKKTKESFIKKYGVDNPFKSEEIRKEIKKRNKEKYGVESTNSVVEIKEKKKNIVLSKTLERILSKHVVDLCDKNDFYNRINKYEKIRWKCFKCGNEFQDYYANGRIPRCPICYPLLGGISNQEKEIVDWLKSLNLEISENNKKIILPLELDIYIPSKNLAIEFDGLYWHSELQGKDSKYHLDKTTKCKEKNIQLLHIWENEWIEKQDIVKSIIKSKLGFYDRAIGARQCSIKEVSSKQASDFYDVNHIQGGINSKANIGLFFGNELVSCISFSKPRYNKAYEWEITRFASLLNTTVHGSFSKLWKYFQQEYKPKSLITYSDKRYFNGNIYRKYFTELQDSGPAYWYIKDKQIYNRVEFQKHKLSKLEQFDSELTEWENMQLNGWDRIWDCGNKVFEWYALLA